MSALEEKSQKHIPLVDNKNKMIYRLVLKMII